MSLYTCLFIYMDFERGGVKVPRVNQQRKQNKMIINIYAYTYIYIYTYDENKH